jgi:hypothetical protein
MRRKRKSKVRVNVKAAVWAMLGKNNEMAPKAIVAALAKDGVKVDVKYVHNLKHLFKKEVESVLPTKVVPALLVEVNKVPVHRFEHEQLLAAATLLRSVGGDMEQVTEILQSVVGIQDAIEEYSFLCDYNN